jgi:hypothetical protein
MSRQKIAQELLCEFIGSGDTYISADDIAGLSKVAIQPVCTGADFSFCKPEQKIVYRDLWVWENPQHNFKYVISADVARGDGKDFSTCHIISQNGNCVAEYKGKIKPEKFALFLDQIGRFYNNAYLCPENNTFGHTVGQKLIDLRYPKIIYEKTKLSQIDRFVPSENDLPGFSTQKNSRELALAKLEEMIRTKGINFFSTRLVNELRTFIWNGQKACAMKDQHDDLVMSAAIASFLFDAIFTRPTSKGNEQTSLVGCMSKSSTAVSTIPGIGNEVQPPVRTSISMWSLHRPKILKQDDPLMANFNWVLK